jgi:hypothetical protein
MPDDASALISHSAAEPADGWARAMLERQLWILGQLAEGGLEIARAIERQATKREATDAEAPPPRDGVRSDLPLAYARVARAVRLTILLQSKLIGDLQTLDKLAAHTASCAQIRADVARPGLQRQMKAKVQRIVGRIAEADSDDADEVERVMREAAERLDQDDIYGDVLARPASEIIARICHDLGLEPDWPALAQEAWVQDEIKGGAAGAPLAALRAQGQPSRAPAPAPIPPPFQAASPQAASP